MREDLRRLLVMRHAKAEAVAVTDHARRLTDRGRDDAAEAGRWARTTGCVPDHAIVSDAARAYETWVAFSASAGLGIQPELDAGLYSAGSDAAIEILRSAPRHSRTLMVVGHNPTMEHLVHLLDDGSADPKAFSEISAGFPTSALAVLEMSGEWADLQIAGARISAFHVGRA